jgi:hypothetical protein
MNTIRQLQIDIMQLQHLTHCIKRINDDKCQQLLIDIVESLIESKRKKLSLICDNNYHE